MRPVVKGPAPQPEYEPYGKALDDLTLQIGYYCSYCEQRITHAPEVEHVQPKSLVPGLEHSWENFLLGCKSCNTVKGNAPVDLAQVAFPDMDNTFRALEFHADGRVTVASDLGPDATYLMEEAVKLVKLHRHPNAPHLEDRPTTRDKRADFRLDAWALAQHELKRYEEFLHDRVFADVLAEQIASVIAPQTGFFSIWMTVFADHPEMLRRFITAFPGTDGACFDPNGRPVPRPNGRF
ncbi:HNH endonuclease signature motif containing protein [Roseovarius aestuariivivens]|uniref:HNH endonuclease signature motif containing protein n=1 Tax=Roseovarius aestuariivivens TaxID=1888910 RepID=UPI0010803124|nr:HNH endonuclease signature motif containing protein [Roseovarius aestuariivivens]